jgi:hypothetical protein
LLPPDAEQRLAELLRRSELVVGSLMFFLADRDSRSIGDDLIAGVSYLREVEAKAHDGVGAFLERRAA